MKIVIINGSARKGNTLAAINAFIKGASEKNKIEIIELASANFSLSVDFQNIPRIYPDRLRLPQIQAGILQPFPQNIFCAGVGIKPALGKVVDGQRVVSLHEVQLAPVSQYGDRKAALQFFCHICMITYVLRSFLIIRKSLQQRSRGCDIYRQPSFHSK